MKNSNNSSTLFSLQLCRGIAACLVLYHHAAQYVNTYYHDFVFRGLFDFGFSGVDFFFLLSGFIIFYSNYKLIDQKEYIGIYLKKRFIRVYPIYWLVILPLILAFLVLGDMINKGYVFSGIEFIKTLTLYPGHKNLTGVSWTLSYEIYFYLLVSLLVVNKRFFWLLYAVVALSFGSLILSLVQFDIDRSFVLKYFLSPYNVEFFLGAVAFYLFKNYTIKSSHTKLLLISGIVLFIVSGVFLFLLGKSAGTRVLCFGIPSFMILLSLVNLERNGGIKVPAWCVKLGDASYSMYLIHYPIISLGNKVYQKILPGHQHYILFNIVLMIFCIVASLLLNRWVEKPVIAKLTAKLI